MPKACPHCGYPIREAWHRSCGVRKLERGLVEAGVHVVGTVKLRKETLVMVYMCGIANLPFLVSIEKTE